MHDPFDVRALDGSALALRGLALEPGTTAPLGEPEHDTLLYVGRGAGTLSIADDSAPVGARSAGLVLAGEEAVLNVADELEAVVATVAPSTDLHAPMGHRDLVTSLDDEDAQAATGSRSFQILFGPHNGSTRATFFAGFIPPGKAPWHYHLYDEIVWVPDGPGRLHLEGGSDELTAGVKIPMIVISLSLAFSTMCTWRGRSLKAAPAASSSLPPSRCRRPGPSGTQTISS